MKPIAIVFVLALLAGCSEEKGTNTVYEVCVRENTKALSFRQESERLAVAYCNKAVLKLENSYLP